MSEQEPRIALETNQKEWSGELRRRRDRLQLSLEMEKVVPDPTESWRITLIQKALFSTWLETREEEKVSGLNS